MNFFSKRQAFTCAQCQEEGLYYYCEKDQIAQLWYIGRNIFTEEQLSELKSKYELDSYPLVPKVSGYRRFVIKQKLRLFRKFLQLKKTQGRTEKQVFPRSPRSIWRITEITKIYHTLKKYLPLPNVLLFMICDYCEPTPRYLFPIIEKVQEREVVSYYGSNWESVEDLLYQKSLYICCADLFGIGDIFRGFKRSYLFGIPSLTGGDTLHRLRMWRQWSSGFSAQDRKNPQRLVLYCSKCILSNPVIIKEGISTYVHGEESRFRIPECFPFLDTNLFHYDDTSKWIENLKIYFWDFEGTETL